LKKAIGAIFLVFNFCQLAYSTDYQLLKFRVEDGLKTDIIKAIDMDSLGFMWIGSDEGLMQYDGNRFLHYPQATESPYIKDLIKLRDGRLLALNDLGLVEIINLVDTVIFREILPGTKVPTDTSLWYPKSIFEDSQGNLWVSEPQSIVRYDGSAIKRIEFGPKHNTPSFIRSFSFAELPKNKILIASYRGSFFLYDNITGAFTFLDSTGYHSEINDMLSWDGKIFIAGSDGLLSPTVTDAGTVLMSKVRELDNVSYLCPMNDKSLVVSTFTGSTYIYRQGGSLEAFPYDFTGVNQTFVSPEGNIWLATERGVDLLKPKIFKQIQTDVGNVFVQAVVITEDGKDIYFSSKEFLRKYNIASHTTQIIDNQRNGNFWNLLLRDDGLWASNTSNIYRYDRSGNLVSSWDFSNDGRMIFDITTDKNGTLWFTQDSDVCLKSIDKKGDIEVYGDWGINKEMEVVRVGKKGIFVGSSNPDGYLYYTGAEDSVFHNISFQIPFDYVGDFRIIDMAIDDENDVIWLASSAGLLKQTDTSIEKLYFEGKFENMPVKAVLLQKGSPYVWFSNAYGLIQLNVATQMYNIYDESNGLPSNTINAECLAIKDNVIWVGTAGGLAYYDTNFASINKTAAPYIVNFYADGIPHRLSRLDVEELPTRCNIGIIASSPNYPGTDLKYQYKINDDFNTWRDFSSKNMLLLAKLKGGDYTLTIRAKRSGNFEWSDVRVCEFTVRKAYYETWYFTAAIVLGVLLLVIITRHITIRILIHRQQELEKLVVERTAELEHVNANLLERNQELDQFVYSTSHDLSAPLKSIRGLINIAGYENDAAEQKLILNKMNESVIKLETFIRDVISYSRNARLSIKKKEFNLKSLVLEILDHISNLDHFQKIAFEIDIDENLVINADETRVRIILNNLISNAVKFQRIEEEEKPFVGVSYKFADGMHHINVRDNGQGIPTEYLGKIFNMFYRANIYSDGSGLGLYILKETLKKLHGDVQVTSHEGRGSEFEVYFP